MKRQNPAKTIVEDRATTGITLEEESELHDEPVIAAPNNDLAKQGVIPKIVNWVRRREIMGFPAKFKKLFLRLTFHFVGLLLTVSFSELLRYLFVVLYGDPKFFDLVPIRFVSDIGDMALIVTFFVLVIRELVRDSND